MTVTGIITGTVIGKGIIASTVKGMGNTAGTGRTAAAGTGTKKSTDSYLSSLKKNNTTMIASHF